MNNENSGKRISRAVISQPAVHLAGMRLRKQLRGRLPRIPSGAGDRSAGRPEIIILAGNLA